MSIDISDFDKTKVNAVVDYWRSISPENENMSTEEVLQCFLRYAFYNEFNFISNGVEK